MTKGWIGVDLDGTLAQFDHWRGPAHIGEPIKPMCDRVRAMLAEGKDVRIFTARWALPGSGVTLEDFCAMLNAIIDFCQAQFGKPLPVTATKDMHMIELWDDRCIQVETNTGRRMDAIPDPAHWTP